MPADVRNLLRARPGARLVWSVMPGCAIIVRVKSDPIGRMSGVLPAPDGKRMTVKEINLGRREMVYRRSKGAR